MMDQFYGVVASEVLYTKSYSDFVQQAGPTISGQLRVINADAQILSPNSGFAINPLIYPRPSLWTSEHEQCSPLFKPENYSSSSEHYHYSGLTEHKHYLGSAIIQIGCNYQNHQVTDKEKGRTANPTLWGIYSSNYETFVVHISTYTKSVGQSSGDSLAFLRCLRLISPNIANEINCPVLSPGVFTSSMSLIISCAIRAVTDCDFVFLGPVAISTPFDLWCKTIYTQIYLNKSLTCKTPLSYRVSYTLVVSRSEVTTSQGATNTNGTSIHNVTETYTMALQHSTQTRPEKKYLWRFLALNRSDMSAKPCRISVEALTEHDARRVLAPFFILCLSARLSAKGVCNV